MKLTFSKNSTYTIPTTIIGLIIIAGLSNTALAEDNKAANGNIAKAESEITVKNDPVTRIAKAPKDLGFKVLDNNGDGKISLQEAVKDRALADQFGATDVNNDGAITAEEYASYASKSEKETAVN